MALFSSLSKFTGFGLFVLRLGVGAMMILHGFPKLTGGPEKWEKVGSAVANFGLEDYHLYWGLAAGLIETLGGLLFLLGLFFRPVCFFLFCTMVVAAVNHFSNGDPVIRASHSIELAFVFLGMLFIGPGRYSIDKS